MGQRQRDRIETTPEQRDEVVQLAVTTFNALYSDDWLVQASAQTGTATTMVPADTDAADDDDVVLRELRPKDIQLTQTWKSGKGGHLGTGTDGSGWRLGVKMKSWLNYWSPAERCAFMVHELGHTIYPHHGESFWEVMADAINRIPDNQEVLDEAYGTYIRKDTVTDYAARSITSDVEGLDKPADRQQAQFCYWTDYNTEYVDVLTPYNTSVSYSVPAQERITAEVPVESILAGIPESQFNHDDAMLYNAVIQGSGADPHGHMDGHYVEVGSPLRLSPSEDEPGKYDVEAGWWLGSLYRRLYRNATLDKHREKFETVPVELRVNGEAATEIPDGHPGEIVRRETVSVADCIEAVEQVGEMIGEPPLPSEVARNSTVSMDEMLCTLQSWETAINRAGFDVERYREREREMGDVGQ